MKKAHLILLFLLTIFFATECHYSPTVQSDNMAFDEVLYIDRFPLSFSLNDEIEVDLGTIGIRSFYIYDSLLICSVKNNTGLWSFFSLPNYKPLGDFLSRGEGPFEFIQEPNPGSRAKFYKENDTVYAGIYDAYRGKVYKMNIDKSIERKKLEISILNDSLPKVLFDFIMIDSSAFFCREIKNYDTQQIRYILINGEKVIPLHFEKLNQAKIKEGEDINIISSIIKQSCHNDLIVEMPIGLNYINLYNIEGSFKRTICIGKKLDNIRKIQSKLRWDRVYTFANLQLFNIFWGVVQINEDEKTYQTNRKKLPSILLFDWEGKPIAELKLNRHITSFDIDMANGHLYTFDVHTDEFYKYNINDILPQI